MRIQSGHLLTPIMFLDRYWGESSPVDILNAKTMQYLTFKNALADTVNFANNVQLPFDTTNQSTPDLVVCFCLTST